MLRLAISATALAAALLLAGCSPPMSAAPGYDDEIAAGLGTPGKPLASGLYRVTGITDETGALRSYADLLAEADSADPPEPMPLPELFALQYHPGSGAYAMLMSFARIYPGDGDAQLLEYNAADETFYLPITLSDDGRHAAVLVYSCTDLPEDFRDANGIGTELGADCAVESAETVRDGLALLDPADATRLEFSFEQALPDLGR